MNKRKMSLNSILKSKNLNDNVFFSFNSILSVEVIFFKKLNQKILRLKLKLDKLDPYMIYHNPVSFVRLDNYIDMTNKISNLFLEILSLLKLIKNIKNLT
jgi:hypothetical protein